MGRHTTKLGEPSRAQTRPPLPYPVDDGRIAPTVQAAMDRRSQRRKSRLAAVSAAAMIAVGGAAGVSMATADEPESGSSGEIVFSGDCGTLGAVSASSSPDSTEMTVPTGSHVGYRNELGTDAELHVGDEVYEIGSGSYQVFVMNQSAEVAMVPNCKGLFADYEAAQVNVTEEQAEDSSQDEEPAGGELPASGSGEDSGESDSDAGGDGAAGQGEGSGPREEQPAETDADADADAQGGDTGEDAEPSDEEEEVNSFGPSGSDEGTDAAGADAPSSEEVVAVDPKAVTDGANGLIALVAIVCLVGVSAAVARTILKQRAAV